MQWLLTVQAALILYKYIFKASECPVSYSQRIVWRPVSNGALSRVWNLWPEVSLDPRKTLEILVSS